jgi:hypothetical protein
MSGRPSRGVYLTPAGAALAIVCFFLPWARVDCAPGVRKSMSGAELGGLLWVVLVAAITILVAFIFLGIHRRLAWAHPIVTLASLAALIALVAKSIALSLGKGTPVGTIRPEDIGVKAQIGGLGTAVGFLLALVGARCMKPRVRGTMKRPRERAQNHEVCTHDPTQGP